MCRHRVKFYASPVIAIAALAMLSPHARAQGVNATRPTFEEATPNLLGASGLLVVPSAYVVPNGSLTLFAGGDSDSHAASAGLLCGLANRAEAGFDERRIGNSGSQTFATIKLSLAREQLFMPALAAGILQPISSRQGQSIYVVASKSIIPYFVESVTGQKRIALKLHAGYGNGLYGHAGFVGAELAGTGGLSGMTELADGRVNIGARYVRRGFAATAGLLNWRESAVSLRCTVDLR